MQHRKKDSMTAALVKKVAAKHGVGNNYVYKVLRGDREHEDILTDYMSMKEIADRIEHIQNNPLMEVVLATVPF